MKTKYTISVLLIAFLMAFSIPIFGGPHSTINNNTKMGIQTSDLTPDVEIEDFSSEEHGTTGLDIDFIDEYHGYVSVYCDQYVNDGPFGTHSKVLYARDAQSGMNTWSVHYLNNPLTHGTIEFSLWLNPGSSCNSPHYHYLKFRTFSDITAFEFRFNLENGNVEYTDGSSYSSNILNLDTKKWYDYEITIDVSLGLYDLRCSEEGTQIEYIEDISYNNIVTIEELYIGTNVGDYGANSRWDDFRFAPDTPDVTAPITTIELSGNLGSNNWFVSDVWVTLTAIDDASGVDYTEYSYDGTNWHLYSEPFIIPTEGEITIYYRSIDNAGNQEAIMTQSLKIDYTAPTTTIELDGIHLSNGWYLSNVIITLSATDDDSGVSFTEYSLFKWGDGTHNWKPYTGPFLYVPSGLNFWYFDLYYRSTDLAGNSETPKYITIKLLDNPVSLHRNFEMIAQDYYDTPDYVILWNEPLPEAEHVMEQAVFFLQQASDKFELGMIYEGFDKVRDSMEFLLLAEDMGADNQKALDYIMTVLNYSVYFQLEEMIDLVGEDNKFVARAIELYDTALSMLAFENYDEAVQLFKMSLKNTNKASGELIEETFIDDLQDMLNDIQELKTEVQQQEPLNFLEQAENKLLLAIEKANNSLLAQSLIQLKDVVKNLLDVQDFGIDSVSIIDAILRDTDDVTHLKIIEAETILMGEGGWVLDNMHIDKAWINYNKAIDYWNAGKYEFALSYYAKAIEKVNDALA